MTPVVALRVSLTNRPHASGQGHAAHAYREVIVVGHHTVRHDGKLAPLLRLADPRPQPGGLSLIPGEMLPPRNPAGNYPAPGSKPPFARAILSPSRVHPQEVHQSQDMGP